MTTPSTPPTPFPDGTGQEYKQLLLVLIRQVTHRSYSSRLLPDSGKYTLCKV